MFAVAMTSGLPDFSARTFPCSSRFDNSGFRIE
jgi:hypothetical protein